jgi:hypothetical protein
MKIKQSLFTLTFAASTAFASPHSARESIQAQQGCYEVTFEFHETFQRQKNYPIRSEPHFERALEWVHLDASSETHVALQHILVIPGMGSLKHWRQEWDYEPQHLFKFQGNNSWEKEFLDPTQARGLWAQRVYQVDDSPRYECAAPWVIWGDRAYWECQTWSPLPRREFSKRSDYNILNRRNRHEIFAWGWKHEQDNEKIAAGSENVQIVAEEKGLNTYKRVDDSRCIEAKNWWLAHQNIWHTIQRVWKNIFEESVALKLKGSIEGKTLWMSLFELADQAAEQKMSTEQLEANTLRVINAYRE